MMTTTRPLGWVLVATSGATLRIQGAEGGTGAARSIAWKATTRGKFDIWTAEDMKADNPDGSMSISRRVFLALSGAAALGTRLRGQARAYTLQPDAAGKTLKDPDGRVVLGYLTSKPEGVPLAGNSACCIHPFNTLGGERATDIAPPDHRDHRGIFFAWHDMDFKRNGEALRGDFWGWGRFAPTEGRVIVNRDVRLVSADARSAEIEVVNDWMINTQAVLRERTTIRAGEEQGIRVLDLTYRFTSDYDVTLNRMAFTGFCFRCRKDGPYSFSDSKGEVTLPNSGATSPESDWPARDWYSHTVTMTDGKIVSSAVIDHPGNPPSAWHGARSVSFLNPCIAAQGPVSIPARQPLALRYRAVVHDGKFPDGVLDRMAAQLRATR
jgi:Methane oxygenase PmoA